jgi:hypothetical protein
MCNAPQFFGWELHMASQLDLEFRFLPGAVTKEIVGSFREVMALQGAKVLADKLGTSDTVLCHALAADRDKRRSRHPARIDWLETVNLLAPNDRIVEALASQRGLDVVPRAELTPEEELIALKAALSETVGPEVRKLIDAKVRKHR